jgi:hypothetical protein
MISDLSTRTGAAITAKVTAKVSFQLTYTLSDDSGRPAFGRGRQTAFGGFGGTLAGK